MVFHLSTFLQYGILINKKYILTLYPDTPGLSLFCDRVSNPPGNSIVSRGFLEVYRPEKHQKHDFGN